MFGHFLLCVSFCLCVWGPAAAMELRSADLASGAEIGAAQIYPRCGGSNVSPQLSWSGAPVATKSYVLTMIDVDVKPSRWSHWIVADLPPATTSLARGASVFPLGSRIAQSNFGDPYYDGPCPPAGSGVHHYQIAIWAMPHATTTIAPDAKATDLLAMLAHEALTSATLTGWVAR